MVERSIAFTVVSAVVMVCCLASSIPFIIQRKHFPIKGRGWVGAPIVNVCMVLLLIACTMLSYNQYDQPCAEFILLFTIPAGFLISTYMLRGLLLLAAHERAAACLAWKEDPDAQKGWWIRHRAWTSRSSLIQMWLVDSLVCVSLLVGMVLANPELQTPYYCPAPSTALTYYLVFAVLVATHAVGCGVLAFMLRRFKGDRMGFKRELKLVSILVLIGVILLRVIVSFFPDLSIDAGLWPTPFVCLLCLGVSTLHPLYRTYRKAGKAYAPLKTQQQHEIGGGSKVDMQALTQFDTFITIDKALESFTGFLQLEFSPENIFFWKDVQSFKQDYHTATTFEERMSRIHYIYDNYIDFDAEFQINISDVVYQRILSQVNALDGGGRGRKNGGKAQGTTRQESVQKPDVNRLPSEFDLPPIPPPDDAAEEDAGGVEGGADDAVVFIRDDEVETEDKGGQEGGSIFDEAHTEVFKLMATDSFARYTRSSLFKKLIADMAAESS